MLITEKERDDLYVLALGKDTGPDIPNVQKALLKRLIASPVGMGMTITKASGEPPTFLDYAAQQGNREQITALAENLIHYFDSHRIGKKSPYRFYILHTETTDTYYLDISVNNRSPFAQRMRRSIKKAGQRPIPDSPFLTPEGEWPTIAIRSLSPTSGPPVSVTPKNPLPEDSSPAIRVFLCHSSGDKESVKPFYARLKQESCKPWLDEIDLIGGQDWDAAIRKAVRQSDIVIVFLSKLSITKSGYVQKEIKFALDVADEKPEGTIFIVPVRLEECSIPDRLSRWHYIDLYKPNGFDNLMKAIRHNSNQAHSNR